MQDDLQSPLNRRAFVATTGAEWQAAFARGELTSRDLVERYLRRIESLDRSGPMLRAVLETNPRRTRRRGSSSSSPTPFEQASKIRKPPTFAQSAELT